MNGSKAGCTTIESSRRSQTGQLTTFSRSSGAHVDLTAADIKLYSTAPALSHPNVPDNNGVVLYFGDAEKQVEEAVLHASSGEPALHWTAAHLADRDFEQQAYTVMKRWLELDRWNRRCRKLGIQYQIKWKTNEIPREAATTMVWNPERAGEALTDVVPAVHLIAGLATSDASLADPVLQLISWMRSRGVDPDPNDGLAPAVAMHAGQEQLTNALERCPEADLAAQFVLAENCHDHISFWYQSTARGKSSYVGRRYEGSRADLERIGFEINAVAEPPERVIVGLSGEWLRGRSLELIDNSDGVFLLRELRVDSSESG